jgi:hypothetical protein
LVEALLALVLGVLIVTATASIAVHSVRTRHEVEEAVITRWTKLAVLEAFRRDMETILPDGFISSQATTHPADLHELIQITALAPVVDGLASLPRRLPSRITYLQRESPEGKGTLKLIRRTQSLVQGDDSSVEEVLADLLYDIRLEYFFEGKWDTAQPIDKGAGSAVPTAVRLSFRDRSSDAPPAVCTVAIAEPTKPASVSGGKP